MSISIVPPDGVEDRRLPQKGWPDLPDAIREVAEPIARAIASEREDNHVMASVRTEENLRIEVERMVTAAVEHPGRFAFQAATAHRLGSDPAMRREVVRGVMVLASAFHPLSRLIYLLDGTEDIHIYGRNHIVVSGAGLSARLTNAGNPFKSDEELLTFLKEKILNLPGVHGNRQLGEGEPISQSQVGGLMRLTLVQAPAVATGLFYGNIRLIGGVGVISLAEYVRQGVMPQGLSDFLEACVATGVNLIIAGGTGAGKTTLLRVLCGLIPEDELVLAIEDSPELQLHLDRGDGRPWVDNVQQICTTVPTSRTETGVTMSDLVHVALRLRPSRIILGEARGPEMAPICQASSTGHDGSMVSLHASDARHALDKAAYYMQGAREYAGSNGRELAEAALSQAFDVVLHMEEVRPRSGIRRVTGVLAVGRDRNSDRWIYETHDRRLERVTQHVGDLPPNLKRKLAPLMTEIPFLRS